jgi:2,3-bisphosphoglycerate-independent phosphoglycerate mutase
MPSNPAVSLKIRTQKSFRYSAGEQFGGAFNRTFERRRNSRQPENLFALLRMAKAENAHDVFVHAILDGRDVAPRTADIYAEALEIKLAEIGVGRVASLCGSLLRDGRQPELGAHGARLHDARSRRGRARVRRGDGDSRLFPARHRRRIYRARRFGKRAGKPIATVKNGDVVIFFNHRADGMRQLVKSLAVAGASEFAVFGKPRIETVCLTEYDRSFSLPVAFRRTERMFSRRFSPSAAF